VRLEDLVDARWIDAPAVATPLAELAMLARAEGFRPALRYEGLDVGGLLALVQAEQGLALLPARVAKQGAPLASPPLVHRTELRTAASLPAGALRLPSARPRANRACVLARAG
jgi:hypothetical protein